MSEKSDLTELQRQAVDVLRGRERASFDTIQSELGKETEVTEELIKNLQNKDVIHTVNDPLSNFTSHADTSSSEADLQSLTFALDDSYQE